MQTIKIYCLAESVVGEYRDFVNASSAAPPSIVKGVEVQFLLRLFSRPNSPEAYNIELLSGIKAWKFALDKDFDESTTCIIEADNKNIELSSVTEDERQYTEFRIPIPITNTVQLNEWMGTNKSKSGLVGELSGYDSEGKAAFVLQLENFSVRNRIVSAGDPEEVPSNYLTEAQVRALIKGEAPVKGVDYWTSEDQEAIKNEMLNQGW